MNYTRKCSILNKELHINTDPLGIYFKQTHPYPSPSTSTSPIKKNDCWRSKCQLTRNNSSASPKITSKSWENMKSPAASFLASFACSPIEKNGDEQEGDEIDDYVIDKIIGYGGFSIVRKGFRISDGKKVAIKIHKRDDDNEDERLEREINIWKSLDHEHIVRLEKVLETDNAAFIICDYCENGNLLDHVKNPLSEQEAKKIFRQLCEAVRYLHQDARICHKDLKLENILLDENNKVKLCDFGLAICQQPMIELPMSPPMSTAVGGSLAYMAPEQLKSSNRTIGCPSTDIWSLGIILYALVIGKLPFHDDYDLRLQQKILNGQYEVPHHLSSDLQDLLSHLLDLDPRQRYTIQQVLASPWLN